MDVVFWLKVGAFWLVVAAAVAWLIGRCKVQERPDEQTATLSEQRALVDDWQAQIRRDVRRDGLRRASQLKAVK